MLPIILALFDRAPGDRSRPTALHGQFVVGGPSRSEVRSDLNIIVRRSGKPPGHQAQTSQVLWPRAPERSCQEPPSICELPAPLASCPRDPGCAAPFSSRIPTGARTDSGEERCFLCAIEPQPSAGSMALCELMAAPALEQLTHPRAPEVCVLRTAPARSPALGAGPWQ